MVCLSNNIFQGNSKQGSLLITVGIIIISREIGDKLYLLSEKDCFFAFERRLITCHGSMILGLDRSPLLCFGGLCKLWAGRAGSWDIGLFAFSLSCMTALVASHGGGSRGLGVVASIFAWVLHFGVGYLGGHLSCWGW